MLDLLGILLFNEIPEEAITEMKNFFIVDIQGIAAWSLLFLIVGLIIGRKTKRNRQMGP